MSKIRFEDVPTPAPPALGRTWLYVDETDGHTKTLDSDGNVFDLTLSGIDTVEAAILGGTGIVVTSGTNTTTIDGHLRYTKAENDAITGSDGITTVSGTDTIDVGGFRTEFVNASGTLQTSIDTNTTNITANVTEILTVSGHLQSEIDAVEGSAVDREKWESLSRDRT